MSRKVCLLQPREIRKLRQFKRKPNCVCHGHISRDEAQDMWQAGDLRFIGLGRTYAQVTATSKRGWQKVTYKVMGEPLGFATMQLV